MSESVLLEAHKLVHGDRGKAYGTPWDNFSHTARLWSPVLGIEVTPEQVALCMILVKVSRECHASKRDNATDIAGYAETLAMVVEERKRREPLACPSCGSKGLFTLADGDYDQHNCLTCKHSWRSKA